GGIGSAVARRFTALGCSCTGVRRRPELGIPEGFSAIGGPDDLDRLLPDADVVVVAAPLTEASHATLDGRRLALLPDGAIVVNVARGGLIDDGALLVALGSGRLRGAVLDVFGTEPLPADSPYWQAPRVLITPHVSGVSPRRQWTRALDLFEDNWRRWVADRPLRNVVDLDAGY
ncbi:MAG TPA: NAD(P)-dependent oxidoreductase, partial [Gemmatimonas sp.]|nr:NAD(P)-dependent oxidoreductase [Gemmatimonas sp.]